MDRKANYSAETKTCLGDKKLLELKSNKTRLNILFTASIWLLTRCANYTFASNECFSNKLIVQIENRFLAWSCHQYLFACCSRKQLSCL